MILFILYSIFWKKDNNWTKKVLKYEFWNICSVTDVLKQLFWNRCSETCVLKHVFWNRCCETGVLKKVFRKKCSERNVLKYSIINLRTSRDIPKLKVKNPGIMSFCLSRDQISRYEFFQKILGARVIENPGSLASLINMYLFSDLTLNIFFFTGPIDLETQLSCRNFSQKRNLFFYAEKSSSYIL